MAAFTHPLTYSIMPSLKGLLMNKMATTATKLPLTASRVLLLSTAVFIFLSGSHAKETRKCYWCGPLAEQVHRSQRAPSCDNIENHVTICDPGYTNCAVVATSPPFVESRYCVKLYQDECYSLFCNSTKTWRMTCPCQGDLCNGRNGEREKEAFSKLVKLTEKTNYVRIKRATIFSSKFMKSINNKETDNMVAETNTNMLSETIKDFTNMGMDNITDDQHLDNAPKEIVSTAQLDENIKAMTVTSDLKNDAKEKTETLEITNIDQTTEMSITLEESISNLENIKVSSAGTSLVDEEIHTESTAMEINNIGNTIETATTLEGSVSNLEENVKVNNTATDLAVDEMSVKTTTMEINKMKNTSTNLGLISNLEDKNIKEILTETSTTEHYNVGKTTEMKESLEGSISSSEVIKLSTVATKLAVQETRAKTSIDQNNAKASENLPSAEALQQNISPIEKSKEQMTTETTLMTMALEYSNMTVLPTSSKNNTGTVLNKQLSTLIAGIILHQYL